MHIFFDFFNIIAGSQGGGVSVLRYWLVLSCMFLAELLLDQVMIRMMMMIMMMMMMMSVARSLSP